jgi:hypothetical protein
LRRIRPAIGVEQPPVHCGVVRGTLVVLAVDLDSAPPGS